MKAFQRDSRKRTRVRAAKKRLSDWLSSTLSEYLRFGFIPFSYSIIKLLPSGAGTEELVRGLYISPEIDLYIYRLSKTSGFAIESDKTFIRALSKKLTFTIELSGYWSA